MAAGRALVDARRAECASRRRGRRSSGRAACRRRRAWRPGRPRSRSRRRGGDRRGSCRSARAAADRRGWCEWWRSSSVMPPSPVVVEVPTWVAPRPKRFLGLGRQRAETHAGDGDRDLEVDRLLGEAGAEPDVGAAFLAIAFERVAADRGAEKQQIVEMRHAPLGAGAADVVDAGRGGAADLRQRDSRRRWPRGAAWSGASNPSIGSGVVDVEIVELARRAVALELAGIDLAVEAGPVRAPRAARACARRASASRCSRRRGSSPRRARTAAPRRSNRRAHRRRRRTRRGCRPAP